MSPEQFLAHLEEQGVRLSAENGQLRFRAKTGALTDGLKAAILERKAELLAHLQQAGQSQARIPKADRSQPLPLSFSQERLWFLDQLEGPSPTYNLCEAWELRGELNGHALEQSVQALVDRHEALRTTFDVLGGDHQPVQKIHASLPVPVQHTDLSAQPESDRLGRALALANATARQTFNLSTGPLLRTHLIKLGPTHHLFVFAVHHIVFDGWSADVAYRELERLYAACCQATPPAPPNHGAELADYAVWERSHLTGDSLEARVSFWRTYLAGAPEQLDLPCDHVRPAVQSYRGDQTRVVFPAELVARLRDLARTERATLYHAALAAWSILLHRYTGQTDLVVGTPVSNRRHAELESAIGFFVNTVAMRARLENTTPVREVLRRIQASSLSALAHSDMPFERLVQALNPKRQLATSPIFQTCLSLQTKAGSTRPFHNLEARSAPLRLMTSKFDLTLWLTDTPEGLRATLEYATDLFSEQSARRILGHYGCILEELVRRPDAEIGALQILTEAERQNLVVAWNATARDYPRERCLHELIEEQARRTPDATALVFAGRTMNYAALVQESTRLAAHLQSLGVGPDVLVGLCVERSFDMVVGLLGILMAGGAYVPIDPAYPADRIAFVLEDARAPVLITQRRLLSTLPATTARIVLVDEPTPKPSTTANLRPATPDRLAYVLYTSGSTGRPKGVQITHRAVVNFLHSMRREPGLTPKDTLLAVTTLSFDIAGLELHLPLTTGARIVIASAETASDGAALLDMIKRQNITLLQATPATWRLLLAAGWKGTPGLKALCGGEALPADLASDLLPRCSELWNMYGPTETTIWSTCCRITDASDIPIGRPIDNTEIYILDPRQNPLPVGIAGELLIGGDGLSRGYLNRPELTADRFVAHPFKPGEKLYRTGDLARYRPDGNIECLGRLDHQVKIRGFRIELGEIESQLANHPDVRQNVVVAREDKPGDKRLVAYLVPRANAAPEAAALRDFLRKNLPDYMLPAAFVAMEALPLTPNGKIDRKALPAPDSSTPAARETIKPRTPAESRLAGIFEAVLGAPVPSVTDSFFDLGGHSLLATRLMAGIEAEFGQRLPLAKLFEAPSVGQLARLLETRTTPQTGWASLVPVNGARTGPALYLVHGAGGNILLYRELGRALLPDVKLFGFQSQGLDRTSPPLRTVEEMARHYIDELLEFQPRGPYFLGGYCMGGLVAYEMARLLRARGLEVGPIAMLDSYNLNTVQIERTFFSRLGSLRQKAFFHFENLRQMSFAEKRGYFREKFRMLIELIQQKSARLTGRNGSAKASTGTADGTLATLQDINHRAGWNYVPGNLDGHLLLFKPRKNYDFFPDPDMGWRRQAQGRIERIELTSHPHSMLIQPHVNKLAAELKARLPAQ